MDKQTLLETLRSVQRGELSPEDVVTKLKTQPFDDIDFAKIDTHRTLRNGTSEIIYGQGKTPEQIAAIAGRMMEGGGWNILITRMSQEAADHVCAGLPCVYDPVSRIGVVNRAEVPLVGSVVVASGGTSDIPVCEEAAQTAEILGNHVTRLYDVGVAGLHRLLSNLEPLMNARVVIAVAGMEGALASVIGGLVDCPVIAVPTSIGYGANFGGLSALLSMLNACASGISVVNIDNGFGAGFLASMINKMEGINK